MASIPKAVVEPVVIVGIFTLGCLINRRRASSGDRVFRRDLESRSLAVEDERADFYQYDGQSTSGNSSSSSSGSPPLKPVLDARFREVSDPGRRQLPLVWDLLSRFWNKYPFLPEIWYWNLTYWVYQLLRASSARLIAGNQSVFDLARTHAIQILSLESHLSIDIELSFQRHMLTYYPDWMLLLARIYYSHICVGVAFIVYCYTCMPRSVFYRIRRTIAMDNAIAFIVVTAWRCSPPRLLPSEYGFVDVLHKKLSTHDNAWTNNRFQLTIAAMPSLHFGTALFFAVCLFRFAPHRLVRWLGLLWPAAMLVTIVATANHFVMDAVVGACIPALGWRLAHWMGELHKYELKAFRPFWTRMDIRTVDPLSIGDEEEDYWKRED